jgi:tetratricopeptide (TPR) repeat protein
VWNGVGLKRAWGSSFLAVGLACGLAASPAFGSAESELAFHRGVVAYGDGKLAEARRSFERVLAEDPEDREALRYLALILKAEGEPGRALEIQDRALALDPQDRELVFDRGATLLELGRNTEARAVLEQVLAEDPDHARARFYAGVAAYRTGDASAARANLERAAELDPTLALQARYYSGLAEASVGDLSAATGSFSVVADQSPISPLGRSAASLTEELRAARAGRPWSIALTAGSEWDSNPTLAGSDDFLPGGQPNPGADQDPDYRGVFTAEGSARLFANERVSVSAGYDGYWSLNHREEQLDLQTHAGWVSGGTLVGPVRVGLRYDYAYTFLSLSNPFRQLHRATPNVAVRQGNWGLTQPYYQIQYANFQNVDFPPNETFERDGPRHLFGLNQYFFLPEPFSYVTVGALGDLYDADGTEWRYDGFETSLGAGYDFPHAVSFSWLWRFAHRDYRDHSAFAPFERRQDSTHWVSAELARPIIDHWIARVAGSFAFQDSNIPVYDHTRKVVGAYLTYQW